MATVNENILSEIKFAPGASDQMKSFLKWLIEFERENVDLERVNFKKDIEAAVREYMSK